MTSNMATSPEISRSSAPQDGFSEVAAGSHFRGGICRQIGQHMSVDFGNFGA
jgi:hypothetical protein